MAAKRTASACLEIEAETGVHKFKRTSSNSVREPTRSAGAQSASDAGAQSASEQNAPQQSVVTTDRICPEASHGRACNEDPQTQATRRTPSSSELPEGCVMGEPVYRANSVSCVTVPAMQKAIIQSIQQDHYCFLRYTLLNGFSHLVDTFGHFTIVQENPETGLPQTLEVMEATTLHYAVCCGSLKAALALLLAFPEQIHATCKIAKVTQPGMPKEPPSSWTCLQLVALFAKVYQNKCPELHDAFTKAGKILATLAECPERMPVFSIKSMALRYSLAGSSGEEVAASLANLAEQAFQAGFQPLRDGESL